MMKKVTGTPVQNVATVRPQTSISNVATVRPFQHLDQSKKIMVPGIGTGPYTEGLNLHISMDGSGQSVASLTQRHPSVTSLLPNQLGRLQIQPGIVQGQSGAILSQIAQVVQSGALQNTINVGPQMVLQPSTDKVFSVGQIPQNNLNLQQNVVVPNSQSLLPGSGTAILAPTGQQYVTPTLGLIPIQPQVQQLTNSTQSQGPLHQNPPPKPQTFFIPSSELQKSKEQLYPILDILQTSGATIGANQTSLNVQKMDIDGNVQHMGHIVKSSKTLPIGAGSEAETVVQPVHNTQGNLNSVVKSPNLTSLLSKIDDSSVKDGTSGFDLYQCVTLRFFNKTESYLVPVQENQRTIQMVINGKSQFVELDKSKFVRIGMNGSNSKLPPGIIHIGSNIKDSPTESANSINTPKLDIAKPQTIRPLLKPAPVLPPEKSLATAKAAVPVLKNVTFSSQKPPTKSGKWCPVEHSKSGKTTLLFIPDKNQSKVKPPTSKKIRIGSKPGKPTTSDHNSDSNDFGLKITNVCSLNKDTGGNVPAAPTPSHDATTGEIKTENNEVLAEITVDAIESVVDHMNENEKLERRDSDTDSNTEALGEADISDSSDNLVTTSLNGPEFARDILEHIGSGDIMLEYADQGPMNAQLVESPSCGSVGKKQKPSKTTKRKLTPTSNASKAKKKKRIGGVPELDADPTYIPEHDVSLETSHNSGSGRSTRERLTSTSSTDYINLDDVKDEPVDILDFGTSSYQQTNRIPTRGVIQQHQQEEVYTGTEIKDIRIKLEKIDNVIGKQQTIYLPNYPQFKKKRKKRTLKPKHRYKVLLPKPGGSPGPTSPRNPVVNVLNSSQGPLKTGTNLLQSGCVLYKLPDETAVLLPLGEMGRLNHDKQVNARHLSKTALQQICRTIPQVGTSYTNQPSRKDSSNTANDGTMLLKPSFMVVPPSQNLPGGRLQATITAPTLRFKLPSALPKQNQSTLQAARSILKSCLNQQTSSASSTSTQNTTTQNKPTSQPTLGSVALTALNNVRKVNAMHTGTNPVKPGQAGVFLPPNKLMLPTHMIPFTRTTQGVVQLLHKADEGQTGPNVSNEQEGNKDNNESVKPSSLSQPSSQSQPSLIVQSQSTGTAPSVLKTQLSTPPSSDVSNAIINLDKVLHASQALEITPRQRNETPVAETSINKNSNSVDKLDSTPTDETSIKQKESPTIQKPEMGFRQKDTVQCERVQRLKEMLKEKEEALMRMRQLRLEREKKAKEESDSDD